MKPNLKRLWPLGVVIFLIASGLAGGWLIGKSTTSAPAMERKPESVEVYFARPDGIYRVTSQKDGEEKVAAVNEITYTPLLLSAGKDQEFLIYLTYALKGDSDYQQPVPQEIHRLTLADGKDETLFTSSTADLGQLLISPDKTKLAFVTTAKSAGQQTEIPPQVLHLWDIAALHEISQWHSDGGFTSLTLGDWLSENLMTLGFGYEGVNFCAFSLAETAKLPLNDQCQGFGNLGMGGTERIFAVEDGRKFGWTINNAEITGDDFAEGIFTTTDNSDKKNFIVTGLVSDALLSGDKIYYFSSGQKQKYPVQGAELMITDKAGNNLRKLTSNGGSTGIKQSLSVSPSGRYAIFQQYFPSDVNYQKAETVFANTSIWLYDDVLGKVFRVAESGRSPVVIHRLSN